MWSHSSPPSVLSVHPDSRSQDHLTLGSQTGWWDDQNSKRYGHCYFLSNDKRPQPSAMQTRMRLSLFGTSTSETSLHGWRPVEAFEVRLNNFQPHCNRELLKSTLRPGLVRSMPRLPRKNSQGLTAQTSSLWNYSKSTQFSDPTEMSNAIYHYHLWGARRV